MFRTNPQRYNMLFIYIFYILHFRLIIVILLLSVLSVPSQGVGDIGSRLGRHFGRGGSGILNSDNIIIVLVVAKFDFA